MEKVRLGIIGVGNMGTAHLNNIMARKCPEIEVTAVADLDTARLDNARAIVDKARAEHPEIPEIATFTDAMELISSGQVDAILVAVPHYDHPRYCIAGLQAGLHVMSEKPAGVYAEQVRELIAEADKHPDLLYGLMFNQRTNPLYAKMRDMVQSGELGQIRRTSWIITNWYRPQAYYDSGSWRATWSGEGGGVLLNQCPHNLDLWQWITGMPCKISANLHFGKWHDIEVEDDATVYVEYPNGATGTFITTTGDAPGANRFEIVMDGGTLICDGNSLILRKLEMPEPEFSKTNKVAFAAPKVETITVDCTGFGSNDQHVGILNALADAILHGGKLLADGREGIKGLTLSNAMHLSAWLGKPVDLPMDDALFKEELMKRVATSRRKENVNSVISDTSASYNI
ncbi:MAG: Gfo/Idh/MocA family oxidoreductase [Clostridia bacterium]|nr:Gfo/Idh/MocA family oxidoreductase [Clostridia bacterium]